MNLPTSTPRPIRTILVGVADPADDPVLRAAIELSRHTGAELHAVHAFELPASDPRARSASGQSERAPAEDEREHTDRLRSALRRSSAGVELHAHALAAPAGGAIVSAADEVGADLIVVGATRQGPSMRQILGSTADRVIRTSKVLVLMLRPPFATRFQHLLLSTDRSELAVAALVRGAGVAAQLADTDRPQVRCLEVTWQSEGAAPGAASEELQRETREQLTRFLVPLALPFAAVEPRVRIGDPAKEIVAEAAEWGADLIIIGTRGQAGITHSLLGSVAGSVLRSALGNVLVVPSEV